VSIVLFALANIFHYSSLQVINFEYVNAIFFIYSVVYNWFLEDIIVDLKSMEKRMKAEMKAAEMKAEMKAAEMKAEISKMEIRFTAELKKKANKIGYQDTKIERRDTKISGLKNENTGLPYDLDEAGSGLM
jgi:hypothetical protein